MAFPSSYSQSFDSCIAHFSNGLIYSTQFHKLSSCSYLAFCRLYPTSEKAQNLAPGMAPSFLNLTPPLLGSGRPPASHLPRSICFPANEFSVLTAPNIQMYINHFINFKPYKLPRSLCTHWSQYAERNNVLDDWIEQWPSQETLNHEGISERTYNLVNRDQ